MKGFIASVMLFACQALFAQQNCRLELNNFEIVSDKRDMFTLKVDLINTGPTDIVLSSESTCKIEFVEPLPPKLESYQRNIEQAILNEKLILGAGNTKRWTLKVPKAERIPAPIKTSVPNYAVTLDNCADLLLTDYKIVKKTNSYLWIEFTLVNRGKKVANLYGPDFEKTTDNVIIKSLLSTSSELSAAVWETGSLSIDKGMKLRNGLLNPQESYTDVLKVDLSGQTKFTNYVILQVDPYLVVDDCNRANNNLTIKMK